MVMRVLAPPRPYPAWAASPFLSLTAHAAVLVAVVGSDGSSTALVKAARAGEAPSAPAGERLHWVGVGPGSGTAGSSRRPGMRPPVAYVVPGRGAAPAPESGPRDRGTGGRGGPRDRPAGRAGGRLDPSPPPTTTQPTSVRRMPPSRLAAAALPRLVVPDVALPSAEVTRLVAGVLAAAPDFARRASRPEDFVPPAALMAELLVRTGVRPGGAWRPEADSRALPIPLVDNPPPVYPAALARAHVGGRVVVEFRIDSTGVVDVGSLQVVQSTDARFTDAVRDVLPRLRFLPAQPGERAVGVTVRQPFLFTLRGAR